MNQIMNILVFLLVLAFGQGRSFGKIHRSYQEKEKSRSCDDDDDCRGNKASLTAEHLPAKDVEKDLTAFSRKLEEVLHSFKRSHTYDGDDDDDNDDEIFENFDDEDYHDGASAVADAAAADDDDDDNDADDDDADDDDNDADDVDDNGDVNDDEIDAMLMIIDGNDNKRRTDYKIMIITLMMSHLIFYP